MSAEGGSSGRKGELRKSCDLCCARKRRCDGDGVNPCTLCSSKGISCTYSKKERRGPKPKPKRHRESVSGADGDPTHAMQFASLSVSPPGGGAGAGGMMRMEGLGSSDLGVGSGGVPLNSPSILDGVVRQQGSPPPPKSARISDVVRLSPSVATGMLGLAENQHLNSFFSGFGSCTQIVQEDEIRGAMIHILSGGQFGMPGGEGGSSSDDGENGDGGRANECIADDDLPPMSLQERGGGSGDRDSNSKSNSSGDDTSSGNERESRKRAKRARLAAGVACLWAGIGVGAMLCGHTAEETTHYAENAREAIKGCYDEVSEEVLRAFLCLAHMHSFREDFQRFFLYTAMAKDVAASLERQERDEASGRRRHASHRGGSTSTGCSEPAKFLLKCFDALGAFLELEGEEAGSPFEGIRMPSSIRPNSTRSTSTTAPASPSSTPTGSRQASMDEEPSAEVTDTGGGHYSSISSGSSNNRRVKGSHRMADFAAEAVAAAAMATEDEEGGGGQGGGARGIGDGDGGPKLSHKQLSALAIAAAVAADPRSAPSSEEEKTFPGLSSAVRVQQCLSLLGDNPIAQHLGTFSLSFGGGGVATSSGSSKGRGKGVVVDPLIQTERAGRELQRPSASMTSAFDVRRQNAEEAQQDDGYNGCRVEDKVAFPSLQMNQVLFVGDTRILEVSMGVDCSCMSVMCKAVAGVPWSEVAAEADMVAKAADAILVPVLSSPSISRSVCAVKLLADSAFSHLCLGATDNALRAVRRFCAILDEFPGIMRFPPWRHCFHWMAGMLESADMRKLYDGLRKGLNGLRMKSMQSLPDFGSAHAIMCNCSHFRCQATHRALAECARRDPYGAFQVPAECRRWGAGATAAAAAASTARAAPEATAWAEKIKEAVDKAARRASPSTNSGATESTTNSTTAAANPPSSDARRGTTNPTNKTKPLSATSASPTKQAQQQQESSASQGTRPATATQAATATSGAKTNWRRGIAAEAGPLQEMGVGVGEEGRATVAGDMQRPIVSESGGGGVPHVGHVEEGCWCEKRGLGTRTPPKGLDSTQCSFDALALSRQSSLSLSGLDEGISPLMDGATFAFPALSNIFWGSSSRAVYGGGSPAVMDLNNINSNSSRGIESRRTGVRTASSSIGGAGEGGPDGGTSSAGGDTMMTAVSVVESVYTGDVLLGDRLAPVVNSVNKNQPWQQRVVANAVMSSSSNDSAPSQNSSNHRGLVMPQRGTSNGCLLPTSTAEKPLRPQLPTTGSGYASTTPTVYSGIDGGSVGGKGTGELVGGVAPSAGVEQQNALENSALWAVLCDTELGGGDEDMEMSDLGCQSSEALDVFAEDLESILSDCK